MSNVKCQRINSVPFASCFYYLSLSLHTILNFDLVICVGGKLMSILFYTGNSSTLQTDGEIERGGEK